MSQLLVFALAVACGFAATYLARMLATRVGLVDKPDGRRKIHTRPVAVAGGLGVLAGTLAALAAGSLLVPDLADALAGDAVRTLALLASVLVIAVVGMLDDLVNLRARYKLAGQILAAGILVGPGGLAIEQVSLFGNPLSLGWLAAPATVFWLLAAMNALNLLDGMDGFLGTVGMIACGALSLMAFGMGNQFVGWVMLATAGGIVGFLRFNLPPATVYLGDCGSLMIGLVVGAAALQASLKEATVAIIGPACLLVLPVLDTSAAIVRRKLTGRGLAIGDRGHLHHVLKANGLPARRVLGLVAALGCVAAGGALGAVVLKQDAIALIAAGSVILILLAGGLFGNAEWRLLRERTRSVLKRASGSHPSVELEVRLQGSADWQSVWQEVTRSAEDLNLHTVCLDVNAPAWHEGYHRRWDRLGKSHPELKLWRVELPLFGHGQVLGRLTVVGVRDDVPIAGKMQMLSEIVDAAEIRATEITRSSVIPASAQVAPPPATVPLPTPA